MWEVISAIAFLIIGEQVTSVSDALQYLPAIEKVLIAYRNGELFTVNVQGDKLYIGNLTIEEIVRTSSYITLVICGVYKRAKQYRQQNNIKRDDSEMNTRFKRLADYNKKNKG